MCILSKSRMEIALSKFQILAIKVKKDGKKPMNYDQTVERFRMIIQWTLN